MRHHAFMKLVRELSPGLEQTKRILYEVFKKHLHLKGLILRSDIGSHCQHNYYQRRFKEKGIIQSMSRKGNCIDKCIMVFFFGVMKNEMFYGHEPERKTFDQFEQAVTDYIDYYNNHRIESKTRRIPPSKFREIAC